MPISAVDFNNASFLSLPEAALVVDVYQDKILAMNPLARDLFKVDAKQAVNQKRLTCFFQEQRGLLIGLTQEVLALGRAWSGELALTPGDSKKMPVEISAGILSASDHQWMLLIIRDQEQQERLREKQEINHFHKAGLLEWKRVQEIFRGMEQKNRLLLQAVGEGIYGVDAEGRTTFINPAAERMLGWTGEELMGRVIHRVIHHSHQDGSIFPLKDCPIYGAFRDGEIKRVGRDWFWCKDGSGFPVEYTSTPIMDSGHPVGAVVVFKDISQRLEAEKELHAALEEVDSLRKRLEMENAYLQEELSAELSSHEMVGKSDAIKQVVQKIGLVAPTDANVLVTGESGTGKELIARAIQQASDRRDRPLIRVNCAAIPKDLFESEFFGHIKGAFTGATSDRVGRFELADGGTLFLDEVGEIPLELQGKLLRVLQEMQFERVGDNKTRTVNARVIAATNRDLREEVREKRFREDLYFRLNVFPIESVPLRKRKEDIPMLAQAFLKRICKRFKRPPLTLKVGDAEALMAYNWPGNVRELENAIERMVISSGQQLNFELETLPLAPKNKPTDQTLFKNNENREHPLTELEIRTLETNNIISALELTAGRVFGQGGAAELLGIKPTTLSSRLSKLKIRPSKFKNKLN